MTEQEWMRCGDPWKLFAAIHWKSSHRKFRLFGVACCVSLWDLAGDDLTRKAIAVAELYADGLVEDAVAFDAGLFMLEAQRLDFTDHLTEQQANLLYSAGRMCVPFEVVDNVQGLINNLAWRNEANANFLRDIVANPHRPVTLDSSWLNSTVKVLAESIYQQKAFDRLPILGDALEEAGCDNEHILNHCREPGIHVRGCWALDLILGKE